MKNTSTTLILLALVLALLLNAWRMPAPAPALAQTLPANACDPARTVQVSGAAVINVTPDRALLQLGVQSNGQTPDGVQAENFRAVQQVIQAARALGVEAKDIATDYTLVYPLYDDYSDLTIKGYRVDSTLSITLREIGQVEKVLVAALKAGANEVQDVQFYTSELRKYRDQARELAVKAAREKAEALAQAAGGQAGCALSVNENTWTQYYGSWRGGRATALWAQNVIQNTPAQEAPALDADSPISLGQIAVRAEVNASFSLK